MYPVTAETPCTQRKKGQGEEMKGERLQRERGRGKERNRETGREEGRKKEIQ